MNKNLRFYPVWDRTTRIFHWINVLVVAGLIGIGLLLLNADAAGIEGEAKITLKKIHVIIGYVFVINLTWRLLWAFFGGYYSRWMQFLPFTGHYFTSFKNYVCGLKSGNPPQYAGHNPVARLIVSLFFIVLTTQAVTGLVIAGTDLYYPPFGGQFAEWVTEGDAARLNALKPGDKSQVSESAYNEMRAFRKPFITLHLYNFYLLSILIIVHITGVVVTEISEKNSLVSAMFTGEKVISRPPVDTDPLQDKG